MILSLIFLLYILIVACSLSTKTSIHQSKFSSPSNDFSPSDLLHPFIKTLPPLPYFNDFAQERLYRKQRLAAAFRLFSKFGYDEGVAGHITVRDPEFRDTFWVNPFCVDFSLITVSNLIRCNSKGEVVEGNARVSPGAFAIHQMIHEARPDVEAIAHAHSPHGRAWSILGKPLDPLTQDACAFYQDHAIYDSFGGVAFDTSEGIRMANALQNKKAVILKNHGIMTVGKSIDSAIWWYIAMERSCQVQLLAEAACRNGEFLPKISHEAALQTYNIVGAEPMGRFQFQPLYNRIVNEQPNLLL